MTTALDPSTTALVRRAWARRLHVASEALGADGPVLVDRPDLTAAVVVRLGDTVAVAAPPTALALLGHLPAPQLVDVDVLLRLLDPLRPSLLWPRS